MGHAFELKMPSIIYSGENALQKLNTVVEGAKKVAIFTDKGILDTGLVDFPLMVLKTAGVDTIVFSDLPPEPTYGQVQKLIDECRRGHHLFRDNCCPCLKLSPRWKISYCSRRI